MLDSNSMQRHIGEGAGALGQDLSRKVVEQLQTLLTELERWNRRVNLTAIRESGEMVGGHVLDSLVVRSHLEGPRVIDVGTGAGFPGLPLAITERNKEFVLLDSNGKKIAFLKHIVGELDLPNVDIVKARIEDYAPGNGFDTVIARALASLPRLVELSAHLIREGGQLLALKGKHPVEELKHIATLSEWEHCVTRLSVPGLEAHERHLVRLYRTQTESS